MRHAYIDVKGVLVHHQQPQPVPLMDELLQAMSNQGWLITILSSYPSSQCSQLLALAGISLPLGTRILSSTGRDKGEVLLADLCGQNADETIFLDDKPSNLHSVKKTCHNRVRVVGFVGSRKYAPAISQWCASSKVELALSTVDLCEGLEVGLGHLGKPDFEKLSERDLVSLIPGLDHPMSATAGETADFNHRRIFSTLFESKKLKNFEEFWSNLGWVTCNECLWKALVESIVLAKSLRRQDVLGSAYKDYEYTAALKSYAKQLYAADLKPAFKTAMRGMQTGINNLGIDAEVCRIANRPMEADRLQRIEQRIQECFG